jgi:hypothetical protein
MNDDTKLPPATPNNQTESPEEFTSLNLSERPRRTTDRWGDADVQAHRAQMQSGARWFYWVAGLSLINSLVAMTNSSWGFLAGLGITQFISGMALGMSESLGNAITVIALILNLSVAGFFVFLGFFAGKGHTWAFIIGIVVYALDALIFLVFGVWLSLAFHAFVLFCLIRGLVANRKWSQLQAELAAEG